MELSLGFNAYINKARIDTTSGALHVGRSNASYASSYHDQLPL